MGLHEVITALILINNKVKVKVTQLYPTLCDPLDYNLPGSSLHGIVQARVLEWIAIPFSRGSAQPRDRIQDLLHCRQILYCLGHKKT